MYLMWRIMTVFKGISEKKDKKIFRYVWVLGFCFVFFGVFLKCFFTYIFLLYVIALGEFFCLFLCFILSSYISFNMIPFCFQVKGVVLVPSTILQFWLVAYYINRLCTGLLHLFRSKTWLMVRLAVDNICNTVSIS